MTARPTRRRSKSSTTPPSARSGSSRGRSSAASRTLQPLGEQVHGLAIHLRPVPFAHHLEIRCALAERCAGAPAVHLQEVGGGGEHVGYAVAQIDMAVAVVIDAVL